MYVLKTENKCTITVLVDRSSPCGKKLFLSDEENKARKGFYIIVQRVKDFKDYQNFLKDLNTS